MCPVWAAWLYHWLCAPSVDWPGQWLADVGLPAAGPAEVVPARRIAVRGAHAHRVGVRLLRHLEGELVVLILQHPLLIGLRGVAVGQLVLLPDVRRVVGRGSSEGISGTHGGLLPLSHRGVLGHHLAAHGGGFGFAARAGQRIRSVATIGDWIAPDPLPDLPSPLPGKAKLDGGSRLRAAMLSLAMAQNDLPNPWREGSPRPSGDGIIGDAQGPSAPSLSKQVHRELVEVLVPRYLGPSSQPLSIGPYMRLRPMKIEPSAARRVLAGSLRRITCHRDPPYLNGPCANGGGTSPRMLGADVPTCGPGSGMRGAPCAIG